MQDTAHSERAIQQLMRGGKFAEARQAAEAELISFPKHPEFLYMKAVAERYLKDFNVAQATIQRLHDAIPEFGRAYQEEGHLFRDQSLLDAALISYRHATRFNPGLFGAWKGQMEILTRKGRHEDARAVQVQHDRLKALPPELLAATNFIYEHKTLKAENLCRAFLQNNPHHIEGMRLLAEIGSRFGSFREADFLLESAIEFDPENIQLRLDYVKILRKRQKFEAALEQSQKLYERDPTSPVFQSHLAIENMQTGNHKRAFELFDRILEKFPNDHATLTSKGHGLKTFGDHEGAVASYRAAIKHAPTHGDAYFGLANLKTFEFSNDEVAQMEDMLALREIGFMDRVHLCFSLGKAFEDRQDFEKAFEQYERGNDLKCIQSRYKSEVMTDELVAQSTICTQDLFEKNIDHGHSAPDPIFIVGLPRAGSTLLEQIIASHSQVDGTLELPNILSMAYRLRGREPISVEGRYPKNLHDLDPGKLKSLGKQFIEETRIHRKGAPFFIDKMPNNFRHIALIKLILPNAKIIDARRHPMACCFSGFKQLFAEGQEFTYGLEQIGQYYRDYVALMDHWDEVLPGQILRVQYEDVVANVETQVRRILDYLGLPFEEACVEFHKTKRSVRTASSEQVRQPIFKSGLEQWRNFEPWLDPLKEALGPDILKRYPI